MLSDTDLISKISDKNYDVDEFAEMALNNQQMRNKIVNLMLTHEKIMVYYHAYYVVSKSSELKPELFYPY